MVTDKGGGAIDVIKPDDARITIFYNGKHAGHTQYLRGRLRRPSADAGESSPVGHIRFDYVMNIDPTPFGFGGWIALTKATDGSDVMMGDLVLLQDEVNPVLSALLESRHFKAAPLFRWASLACEWKRMLSDRRRLTGRDSDHEAGNSHCCGGAVYWGE